MRWALSSLLAVICAQGALAQAPAQGALSVHTCLEDRTCDAEGRCTANATRVVIAEVRGAGAAPYYSAGPLMPQAGAGTLYPADWRWMVGGVPAPSAATGRAQVLSTEDGVTWRAHVFRPGREVRGLNADWVRADYTCKQVVF